MDATRARLAEIGAFLFLPSSTAAVDVAICLGCTCYQRAAMQAVRLFQSGQCKTLLFTGGPNRIIGGNEAVMMAGIARSLGVAPDAILIDDASTNTLENSLHSWQILEQKRLLARAQAVGPDHQGMTLTLVSIHYHSRRARETFSRAFGQGYNITTNSYPSADYSASDWFACDKGLKDVADELRKMQSYLSMDTAAALRLCQTLAAQRQQCQKLPPGRRAVHQIRSPEERDG